MLEKTVDFINQKTPKKLNTNMDISSEDTYRVP
jgi:hypothetical protein